MIKTQKNIKRWIIFFMIMLALSGLTAIPAEQELEVISRFFPLGTLIGDWIDKVYMGVADTNARYPFIAYGYDWLAFAHFSLALLFIGPLRDPVKNKWVIEFGMIACALIIPFALIAGHFRGIPFWWRLVDCSFGLIGIVPLFICWKQIQKLEAFNSKNKQYETLDAI
jgi:hypothetical protein